MLRLKFNCKKGFTLIELLVVISIIGILIAFSMVSFSETRKTARDSKRRADLEQIRSALEIYRNEEKAYPTSLVFGGKLEGDIAYIEKIPVDPLPSNNYCYNQITPNEYCLCAFLEAGDPEDTSDCDCDCDCIPDVANSCNYKTRNF
ncbi:MAG: type II secretion system protein [Patescibacteria group bacterium]|jgi:general secretion pathway protein G